MNTVSQILAIVQAVLALAPGILQTIQTVEAMFATVPQSGSQKLAVVVGAAQAAAAVVPNSPITPDHAAQMATGLASAAVTAANAVKLFQHGGK